MSLTKDEFKCKHCGELKLDEGFFARALVARKISDCPYIINSGYRCEVHNKAVGSTSKNHTSGHAMDIRAIDGPTRMKILRGLVLAGFTRIGIAKDFIHADDTNNVEACWLY